MQAALAFVTQHVRNILLRLRAVVGQRTRYGEGNAQPHGIFLRLRRNHGGQLLVSIRGHFGVVGTDLAVRHLNEQRLYQGLQIIEGGIRQHH